MPHAPICTPLTNTFAGHGTPLAHSYSTPTWKHQPLIFSSDYATHSTILQADGHSTSFWGSMTESPERVWRSASGGFGIVMEFFKDLLVSVIWWWPCPERLCISKEFSLFLPFSAHNNILNGQYKFLYICINSSNGSSMHLWDLWNSSSQNELKPSKTENLSTLQNYNGVHQCWRFQVHLDSIAHQKAYHPTHHVHYYWHCLDAFR